MHMYYTVFNGFTRNTHPPPPPRMRRSYRSHICSPLSREHVILRQFVHVHIETNALHPIFTRRLHLSIDRKIKQAHLKLFLLFFTIYSYSYSNVFYFYTYILFYY